MNKDQVARHFGQAAAQYDHHAHLQRQVADHLLTRCTHYVPPQIKHLVDLGTGTGYCLPALIEHFHPEAMFALDLSVHMLQAAQVRCNRASMVCGDLETLAFGAHTLDLAVSSLAMQWLAQPETVLMELLRVLKPGGYLAFSSLGPKTLHELKSAWQSVDSLKHVNDFLAPMEWLTCASRLGYKMRLYQRSPQITYYQSPLQLVRELKGLGAHYVERDNPHGAMSLKKMLRHYPKADQSPTPYQASWDVYYVILQTP